MSYLRVILTTWLLAVPLIAAEQTPLPWGEEIKRGDITVVLTKIDRPPAGMFPMLDALPFAEGVMVSIKTPHESTATFKVTVRAKLVEGGTAMRSDSATRARGKKEFNEVLVMLGKSSAVYDVTVEEYAEPRVTHFSGSEDRR